MAKPAPQTFGKYQILERIATGGMAEIYKARLEGIGGFQRTFAIKRILPHLSMNSEYVSMLVDEAKVAGLLSHANIVQILDLGQVDKVWYIAMEYVAGRDLGAVLRRCQERGLRLPVPHACFITIELLKGLEYAHQRTVMRGGRPVALNIIHRDVSPPNILMSVQGEVKLTDFGIARASLKAAETQAGVIKGRFDYMSPEQAAAAKDLDQRSDLFAVGVVLYEMLAGVHPFRGDNEIATLEAVRSGRYVPVSQRNPEVPVALQSIVDRALRVDRNDRFPSASAFKEALDRFFHDAQFVFSSATLAAYIRGLFPQDGPQNTKTGASLAPQNAAVAPVPLESRRPPDAPAEEGDGPTRVIDQKVVKAEMDALGMNDRFGLKPSEEATQVRPNPLTTGGSGAYSAAPGGSGAYPAGGSGLRPAATGSRLAATGSRPSLPPPEPSVKAPIAEAARDSIEPAPLAPLELSTLTAAGAKTGGTSVPLKPRTRVTGGGIGLGAVVFLSGLSGVLGVVIGLGVAVAVAGVVAVPGRAAAPAAALSVGRGAELRVQAPPGAVVEVDGKVVSGSVALTAGVPHRVRVSLGEGAVWDQEIALAEGEIRALVVSATGIRGR